jgi:hypothetical protein
VFLFGWVLAHYVVDHHHRGIPSRVDLFSPGSITTTGGLRSMTPLPRGSGSSTTSISHRPGRFSVAQMSHI